MAVISPGESLLRDRLTDSRGPSPIAMIVLDFRDFTHVKCIGNAINPTVFDPSFVNDQTKKIQWQGFIRKAKLSDAPESFEDIVAAIKVFLEPLVASLAEGRTFRSIWSAPGPWR